MEGRGSNPTVDRKIPIAMGYRILVDLVVNEYLSQIKVIISDECNDDTLPPTIIFRFGLE